MISSGCVSVYQPLSGLHRPVVVDPGVANFPDLRLSLRCIPGRLVAPSEASALCQKVAILFENQGAIVRTLDDTGRADDLSDAPTAEDAAPVARTDLTLEIRPRIVEQANHPLSWALSFMTFTILPATAESTFVQEITIRDADGFLLVSDSLEGRMIFRFGAGPWVGNKVLDKLVREKDERLTGKVASEDLSRDMYRQMSQLVFNAKMKWEVLRQSDPATARTP